MKYGNIAGLDKPVSRIVQGSIQVDVRNEEIGFAQMDAAFARGINAVDTAYIYGGGANDRFIGNWMRSRDNREKVVVLAKGNHPSERNKVTPFDIAHDLHETLARMKTDYVDLYVLHRDDLNVPVEPIVDELNRWHKEGKIKAFGGSNWTPERLQMANAYAKSNGLVPFACSSPNFSLAEQLKEPWGGCVTITGPKSQAARDWYAAENMPLFTWSSMAGGFMSGRITRDNTATFEEYFNKLAVECYASEENFTRLDRAKEIADKKGLTMPQIALAYVLNYPLNIFPLVGSANNDELDANVQAVETELTPEEMAYLDLRD
jgi:aryl-alcohol dehydrogenase-like predicted oxidoreductase